ncbi:ABC transporter permease [Oricola sp.]|uniref:ABC transporter permease n=1 Tax=Oricola sp. TaxID=1979950 RepID=UPI0025F47806|nr:ABC transporter permease [Oricola sp.]MCI5077669.1 ABC transporter permease [Oricola sp.]
MRDSLLRIVSLVRKEVLALVRDPRSRVILFVPPLLQSMLFGYAATFDLNHAPYAIYDEDRSAASGDLVARLEGSGVFERVATIQRSSDIARLIDDRDALLVVHIGPDFARKLSAGQKTDIQVIADGRNSNTAGTAVAYVSAIVDGFNADWRAAHGMVDPPVTANVRAWYNGNLETSWNMIPGLIGTITMLQVLMLTALSVAREREDGTFDQLLVTPIRPAEIMLGKALPSTAIGLIQATIILLVAQLWFRIPFAGSLLTLYGGLIPFVIANVGIGLFISSLVANMQQAMLFSFVILMPFILLSGLATPVANMPDVFQWLTLIDPLRYALDITRRVYLEGATLGQLVGDLWPMILISAVTLPIAAWMFRNRLS